MDELGGGRTPGPGPRGPQPEDAGGGDLTAEERAVLPPDDLLHRLIGDRRVRLALIFGVPTVVGLFIAVGVLATQIGVPHSVTVEGAPALVSGATTTVRVGYSESDEWGLPEAARIDRVRLELCPGGREDAGATCLLLGEARDCRRGTDVEVHLTVPPVPVGRHPLRIEVESGGDVVRYAFLALVDPEAAVGPPNVRENGRVPSTPLGDSGVTIDLVPEQGGIVREAVSPVVLRARRAGGGPWAGTLFMVPAGDMPADSIPATVATDDLGLAAFDLRPSSFEVKWIVSAAPVPEIDPLELEVGLVPAEALAKGALIERGFRPVMSRMTFPATPESADDRPMLGEGDPLLVAFARDDPRTVVLFEVWQGGRLLGMASGVKTTVPQRLPDFRPPRGLVFVQAHAQGQSWGDVMGRHVLVGAGRDPDAGALGQLIGAIRWSREEAPWVASIRGRIGALAPPAAGRLAAYLFGRLDGVWYPYSTVFDSRPADAAKAERIRGGIQGAMAWGLALTGGMFLLACLAVTVATIQYHRSARKFADTRVRRTGAGGDVSHVRVYDEESWWEQYAVLVKGAVGFIVLASALVALGVLLYGMRSMYLVP